MSQHFLFVQRFAKQFRAAQFVFVNQVNHDQVVIGVIEKRKGVTLFRGHIQALDVFIHN